MSGTRAPGDILLDSGSFFPNDLLWSRASWTDSEYLPPDDTLRPPFSRAFAPSWSWASVDGHVLPNESGWSDRDNVACEVLKCNVVLADERLPYGHVLAASVTLRGVLVPAPWVAFSDVGTARYLSLYTATNLPRDHRSR